MRQHGMSSITQQDRLSIHIRPLLHGISIIQSPLPRIWAHALNNLTQGLIPTLILFLQVLPPTHARPALLQIAQLVFRLRDKRNHIHGLVLADREDQEMLVLGQPANGIGFEGPERFELLEGEEAAVGDASAVPGLAISDELLADVGVDAVGADK